MPPVPSLPPVPGEMERAPRRNVSQRSVGRRRSRAGVSAQRNVEDARRRRRGVGRREWEDAEEVSRRERGKGCVVM